MNQSRGWLVRASGSKTRVALLATVGWALGMGGMGCAIGEYPGHPGIKTNNSSRLDLETLDAEGLWTFETQYDNRDGGSGVNYVITRLYPKAQTFTSNVRTNEEGTLYRTKLAYRGSEVQAISLPRHQEIIVPEGSVAQMFTGYEASIDEIDTSNLVELDLFRNIVEPTALRLNAAVKPAASAAARQRSGVATLAGKLALLQAAQVRGPGVLGFQLAGVKLGGLAYRFAPGATVELSLSLNGVRSTLDRQAKADFARFVTKNFPKGFRGELSALVQGGAAELPALPITIDTLETLEHRGVRVLRASGNDARGRGLVNFINQRLQTAALR